jgi:hypothetical protein
MVERFYRLGFFGKLATVILVLGGLMGCYFGSRNLMMQQRSQTPMPGAEPMHHDDDDDDDQGQIAVKITQSGWAPAWTASSSTFTGQADITRRHGHSSFKVTGELKLVDASGNLIRSYMAIQKVKTREHEDEPEHDREHEHGGTTTSSVTFTWTWDGTNGAGQPVADGSYGYTFTVSVGNKKHPRGTDSRSGTVGVDKTAPAITIDQPAGEITGSSAPVSITWSDAGSGIDASTGSVTFDGTAVSGLTMNASGASGTIDGVAEGTHVIEASVRDLAGNSGSASGDFTVVSPPSDVQKTLGSRYRNRFGGRASGGRISIEPCCHEERRDSR